MATPAAILAIEVKANTAAAQAGLAKTQAQLQGTAAASGAATRSTARTSAMMRKLGTAAKWAGLAVGAAFVIEAKRAVTTTQELTKSTIGLHKNLGLTNEQASKWAGVAKARGVDSTKLGMAFKTLATQITAARDGSETSITMFKRLGFSQRDIQRAANDTNFAVKKVSDGLKEMGAGADRTTISGKLFGRGWQTIAPIMRDGSKAMQEQLNLVEKYGGVLKGETLKRQEELLANIRENKIAYQGFQITLANLVTPTLNDLSDQFQKIAAINARKDLTGEEKWRRISRIIRDDFTKAMDVVVKLIPEVASRVGEAAPKIAVALVKGFLQADVWGKLFLGGWFISKLGGPGTLGRLGAAAGKKLGMAFARTALGAMLLEKFGLGMLIPGGGARVENTGKTMGKRFGRGLLIGLAIAIPAAVIWASDYMQDHTPKILQLPTLKDSVKRWGKIFGGIGHWVKVAFRDVKRIVGNIVDGIGRKIDELKGLIDSIPDPRDIPGVPGGGGGLFGSGIGPDFGAKGGLVTEQGIKYLAAGGMARGTDTVPAMLTPGEGIVSRRGMSKLGTGGLKAVNSGVGLEGESGQKLLTTTKKVTKDTAKAMTDNLGKGNERAAEDTEEFVKRHGEALEKMKDTGAKFTERLKDNTVRDFMGAQRQGSQAVDKLRDGVDKDFDRMRTQAGTSTQRLKQDVTGQFDRTRTQTSKSTEKMKDTVSADYRSLTGAVSEGLGKIAKMTNNALKALGVNKVDFNIGVKGEGKQRGGQIDAKGVPTTGDHIPAMLEKGEFVVNSKAAKKHRAALEQINFRDAPRFQKGGAAGGLDFALGPETVPPIQFAADHAGGNSHVHITGTTTPWVVSIGRQLQKMGFMVGEHPAFGGVNAQHSATGGHYDALAIDVNSAADETHAELVRIANLLKTGAVGAAEKIARVLLRGPDGPLKDMGQAALDRVRRGANAFLSKQAPSGVAPKAGGSWDKNELTKLWRATGSNGVPSLMAAIALAESGGNPRAVGPATSSGHAHGLWQIMMPLNQSYVPGGNAFDPKSNAIAAHKILAAQGLGAWEAYTNGNYSQFMQRGGFMDIWGKGMAHLQKGGEADDLKVADLSIRNLVNLLGERGAKGKLKGQATKTLLGKLHGEQKGVPIKPGSDLERLTDRLSVLELTGELHPKSKGAERKLNTFLKSHALDMVHAFRRRKEKYHDLKLRQKIAAHTPGDADDKRIAKLLAKFLGKKPGEPDLDAVARTQQFFDFLKLLGPTTPLSTFAKGGTLGAGKFGIAGERGPELVQGPATIHSAPQTAQMLKPQIDVHVYVGDREITDIVRVEIKDKERRDERTARTGLSPAR